MRRRLLWTALSAYGVVVAANPESLLLANALVLAVAVVGGAGIGTLF